ncbi:hypothetical protein ACIBKY_55380 [Nonomuraea sp. NPDC050394]|uniref:hypothetical protein n=1 Tax=Nonomuraea sp. NPDC050394 TaxID=3364363 RepID=UPI00378AEEE9
MKFRTLVFSVAAALSLLAVSTVPAFADPGRAEVGQVQDPSIDNLPSKTELTPLPGSEEPGAAALPPGCWGHSDAPYKGGLTDVFGFGETYCPASYPEIYVDSDLQRSRWFGWETLDTDSERNFWSNRADVDLSTYCFGEGTYDYRVKSYHEVHASQISFGNTVNRTNGIGC